MSDPIKVSQSEYTRLAALKAMQETGQLRGDVSFGAEDASALKAAHERDFPAPPPTRNVAEEAQDLKREMWETSKRIGRGYLIYRCIGAFISIILFAIVATWVVSGILQVQRNVNASFRQQSQAPSASYWRRPARNSFLSCGPRSQNCCSGFRAGGCGPIV